MLGSSVEIASSNSLVLFEDEDDLAMFGCEVISLSGIVPYEKSSVFLSPYGWSNDQNFCFSASNKVITRFQKFKNYDQNTGNRWTLSLVL